MANKTTDYRKELFYQPKHGYDRIDAKERAALEAYAEEYKTFLDTARTEREAVKLCALCSRHGAQGRNEALL